MTSRRNDARRASPTAKGTHGATTTLGKDTSHSDRLSNEPESIIDQTAHVVDDLYRLTDNLADRAWRSKSARYANIATHMMHAFAHAYRAMKKLEAVGDPVGASEKQEEAPQ